MSGHVLPLKTYFGVFALLMILLLVTVGAAYVNFGPFSTAVAMAIAVTKAVFIVLYFMHVKYSTKVTWVVVPTGFLFLSILLLLTFGDYVSRNWLPTGVPW